MRKLTVLGITNGNTSGVAFHRFITPFNYMVNNSSDEVEALHLAAEGINLESPDLFNVDICHFHANICSSIPLIKKLLEMQKKGCKLVMDLDDFFQVPITNPYAKVYNETLQKPIKDMLLKVDYLTTTTKLFKEELKKWTKKSTKIFVIPNVLDNIPQFQPRFTEHNRLRIGVICGASHQKDIELLEGVVKQLGKYNDLIQWSVNGFDTRLNKHPELSVWNTFEQVFTDEYSTITEEYRDYLLRYDQTPYPMEESQPYRRYWAKDIYHYGELFHNVDILLAPLVNDKFNCMKSELKVVEAGTMGKVFIGSAVGIYKEVITNGYDGLLVANSEGPSGWAKHIRRILDNPDIYYILQTNLNNMVNSKYSIDRWNKKRIEFYRSIKK